MQTDIHSPVGTAIIRERSDPDFWERLNIAEWRVTQGQAARVLYPGLFASESAETVIRSDELDLRSIARARGQVVIEATDEQTQHILDHHREDAFPPE